MTRLNDLKTFLQTIDSDLTIKTYDSIPNTKKLSNTAKKCVIKGDGVIMESKIHLNRITVIYPISLKSKSQASLEELITNLHTNIRKLLEYQAIAGYTKPNGLIDIRPFNQMTKMFRDKHYYNYDTSLLVEWEI